MHRRLLIILLIIFSQVGLRAQNITLSAESFTWEAGQMHYERNDCHQTMASMLLLNILTQITTSCILFMLIYQKLLSVSGISLKRGKLSLNLA